MNFFNQFLLQSGLEMSSLLSFLAVTVCVGAVVTFFVKAAIILRVQQEDSVNANLRTASYQNGSHGGSSNSSSVPRLKMSRVHIPFTFKLVEKANTSYEEVCLGISSQVRYSLQAFWAVSIRELHISLWRPWSELQLESITTDRNIVDKSHYQHLAVDIRNKLPHSEEIITLKCPKSPLALGAPPRLSYPLVIFLIREFDTAEEHLHPNETVILVNVVHLRDPVCPLPTSILAQYLKQASGQLSCLKQLYLATGGDLSTSDEAASLSSSTGPSQPPSSLSLAEPVACAGNGGPILCSDGGASQPVEQLCVVCHYFPLSRALLPCRHTCICAVCFSKLERCPMCRSPITSYFCIRSEEYLPPNFIEQRSTTKTKGSSAHWLDALNDRLTDFLGFR